MTKAVECHVVGDHRAEASVTLDRGGVTLYVPLVPELSAEVLDAILRAADMPRARFDELMERFGE